MTAMIRVESGQFARELQGLAIVVNGQDVGVIDGPVTEVETPKGWSIIVLGHGIGRSAPARFHAYADDVIEVFVHRREDGRVPGGGLLGGRYFLTAEHPQPLPAAPPDL